MMKMSCTVLILFANLAFAQTDTLKPKVDSLFIRASAGELKNRNLVGPAVKTLRETPGTIPYLVAKLDIRDARERRTLIDSLLGQMPDAILPVCEATKSSNRDVVRTACEVLAKLKDSRAVPYLLKVLDHPDIQARGYASLALGKSGGAGARDGLLKALSDSVNLVRTEAAAGLGYLRQQDTSTLSSLILALADDYYGVRFAALNSLVKFNDRSLPHLYRALESQTPLTRQLAAEALGKMRSPGAPSRLTRLLKSPLWADRLAAIEALAEIDTPASRQLLSSHIESEPLVKNRLEELRKK